MKKTDRLIILLLISFFQTSHAIASGLVRHNDIEDSTWISDLHKDITDLTDNEWFEKTQLGLCIYDLTTDTVLFEHNPHQRLRPASTNCLPPSRHFPNWVAPTNSRPNCIIQALYRTASYMATYMSPEDSIHVSDMTICKLSSALSLHWPLIPSQEDYMQTYH